MKTKGCKTMTWAMRLKMEALLNAGMHKKEVAKQLGVCLSTVYNEMKRGAYDRLKGDTWEFRKAYSPDRAQAKANFNKTSKGAPLKLGNDYAFVAYVNERVSKGKVSPGAVLGEIKRKQLHFDTKISKTTLYRYIRMGLFPNIVLADRKKKYKQVQAKRSSFGKIIEVRPKEIDSRVSFGHWEMDCVCGKSKTALLTLSERRTRKELIFRIPNQKAQSVVRCLNVLEQRYGKQFRQIFKTITVDNGAEFANVVGLERSRYSSSDRTQVYYCHPYRANERGTNERLNRDIRKWIPKGSDISKWSEAEIKWIENWMNNYPREIFGFETAEERFQYELSLL